MNMPLGCLFSFFLVFLRWMGGPQHPDFLMLLDSVGRGEVFFYIILL